MNANTMIGVGDMISFICFLMFSVIMSHCYVFIIFYNLFRKRQQGCAGGGGGGGGKGQRQDGQQCQAARVAGAGWG